MDVEAEIRDLKRRMSEIEGSFGFLSEQVKSVHRDLLAFHSSTDERFDKIDARFDKLDRRADTAGSRLDRLDTDLRELRHDLPEIVGSAMREVLSERRGKG